MQIDFSSVREDRTRILAFSQQFTLADVRQLIVDFVTRTRAIIEGVTDAQLFYEPTDATAHDGAASNESEVAIGWSLAHLLLHVTASAEEGAAFASLLGRGVVLPEGARARWEPDWKAVKTRAEILTRLDECQKICLAYLDAMPFTPQLDTYRIYSGKWAEGMQVNVIGSGLFGLMHWDEHFAQFEWVAAQAKERA